jgi:hypothetical protein
MRKKNIAELEFRSLNPSYKTPLTPRKGETELIVEFLKENTIKFFRGQVGYNIYGLRLGKLVDYIHKRKAEGRKDVFAEVEQLEKFQFMNVDNHDKLEDCILLKDIQKLKRKGGKN